MTACKTCELLAARDSGAVPPWDAIYRTPFWDVVHSFDTRITSQPRNDIAAQVKRYLEANLPRRFA